MYTSVIYVILIYIYFLLYKYTPPKVKAMEMTSIEHPRAAMSPGERDGYSYYHIIKVFVEKKVKILPLTLRF